jgi:hypothetical protein
MFKIQNPTFGTDPEFFGISTKDDTPLSVAPYVPGEKQEPFAIGKGVCCLRDNVLAEITTPPTESIDKLIDYVEHGKLELNEILHPFNIRLSYRSSMMYTQKQVEIGGMEFGCSESFNAYHDMPVSPDIPDTPLRTAGFHMHVGFFSDKFIKFEEVQNFIKYCDVHAGVPSVIVDTDNRRRQIYGEAGDFRYHQKKRPDGKEGFLYIIEYRSLGGAFALDRMTMRAAFTWFKNAIDAFNNQDPRPSEDLVKRAINQSDIEAAKFLSQEFSLDVPDFALKEGYRQYKKAYV